MARRQRILPEPTPVLATCACPACGQMSTNVSTTQPNYHLYLSCLHCGGRLKGDGLVVRYLADLPYRKLQPIAPWSREHLRKMVRLHQDDFQLPAGFEMDPDAVPEHVPDDAKALVECPGCHSMRGMLKGTRPGKKRGQTGGKPFLSFPCCNGQILGVKMALRYLAARWDSDRLVILDERIDRRALHAMIAEHAS